MKINITMGGTPPYVSEILIGEDVMENLPGALDAVLGGRSAYWIWDEAVWSLWGRKALDLGWPVQRDGQGSMVVAAQLPG